MDNEPLTIERFKEIVDSKNLDQLIGHAENNFFDAKESFYNLSDQKDKHELCKDITAFANNNGGYLIIGCKTEKAHNELADYIKSTDGLASFPSMDGVYSILSEYIYPNSIGTFADFAVTRNCCLDCDSMTNRLSVLSRFCSLGFTYVFNHCDGICQTAQSALATSYHSLYS